MKTKLTICKEILKERIQFMESPASLKKYCDEKRFIRKRKLSMKQLIYFLFYSSKASMNLNLANIKDDIPQIHFPAISKQAVSKARKALFPELFQKILQLSVSKFYSSGRPRKTWHGLPVFAVDGSKIQVPTTKDNIEYFGICRNQHHSREDSMACISTLYDVLEDIIVDGILQKYTASERPAAVKHLAFLESLNINKNSVVLFDRGYPSYEFYRYFNEKGYYFLMRIQGNVTSLTQLGKEDAVTEYLPSKKKKETPVKVRVLHVILDDATEEYLVTNILDPSFTIAMFQELYFLRWGIEGKYNELKNQLELEEFNGAHHASVEQEFYIKLFFMNLCALLKAEADQMISKEQSKSSNQYRYQANRAFLHGRIKKKLVTMLTNVHGISEQLDSLVKEAAKKRSQIQPNRTCKRPRIQLRRRHCKNRKTAM